MMSMKEPRGGLASSGTGPAGLDREARPRHWDLGRQYEVSLGLVRDRGASCGLMLG